MLNDENVPVPSVYNKENKAYGKETTYTIAPVILWDSSRVWKILTAYVYTGAMVLGKTKTLISGKSIVRTVPKGQQFITEGTHEAIVSREEFEKAQLVIKSNSHKVLMGGVDFPLKGKVRCGNCRRVMAHNFKQVVPTFWCREGLELVGQTQCTSEIFQVSDIESAVFQALKKELSLLDSLYGDMQKEELALKEAHKKANRRKTLMEQEFKNLKGEKMRMYEEYAAGTLPLDTYKQKKQECDRRISEVQEQIEQSKAEESAESVVPGTVRAAAEQAENFLHGTRLTAGMVSAFIENVFVHDGWSNIPPDREADKDDAILIHVITFGSNSRARGRVAHFDGTAGLLVHPVQIGLGVWNFRLNLKNVCTDGIRQIFGNFCSDTAGRKVGDKSFAHSNALPLDNFV